MQPQDRLVEDVHTECTIYAHTASPLLANLRAPLKKVDDSYIDLKADSLIDLQVSTVQMMSYTE